MDRKGGLLLLSSGYNNTQVGDTKELEPFGQGVPARPYINFNIYIPAIMMFS